MTIRRNFLTAIIAARLATFVKISGKPRLAPGYEILQSFDARDWARHFVNHVRVNPSIATDEGTMVSWFANALMRGFDEARRKDPPTATRDQLVADIRGAVARGWCAPRNTHKEMDCELAEAITQEIIRRRLTLSTRNEHSVI